MSSLPNIIISISINRIKISYYYIISIIIIRTNIYTKIKEISIKVDSIIKGETTNIITK